MRVLIWGAGKTGSGIARRLVLADYVQELRWFNRSAQKLQWRRIDIEHGLAYAPRCERVIGFTNVLPPAALDGVDAVVLTHGVGVGPGQTRVDCYTRNRQIFRSGCLPMLRDFDGLVLVVTNPSASGWPFTHGEREVPGNRA